MELSVQSPKQFLGRPPGLVCTRKESFLRSTSAHEPRPLSNEGSSHAEPCFGQYRKQSHPQNSPQDHSDERPIPKQQEGAEGRGVSQHDCNGRDSKEALKPTNTWLHVHCGQFEH